MTVNHDVTGSSPVRGAIEQFWKELLFFCFLRSNQWHQLNGHCFALRNGLLICYSSDDTTNNARYRLWRYARCHRAKSAPNGLDLWHHSDSHAALSQLRNRNSEVVASIKQLSVVLCEAKPPKARSEPSRVYRGDRSRLCDGGETCAWPYTATPILSFSTKRIDKIGGWWYTTFIINRWCGDKAI